MLDPHALTPPEPLSPTDMVLRAFLTDLYEVSAVLSSVVEATLGEEASLKGIPVFKAALAVRYPLLSKDSKVQVSALIEQLAKEYIRLQGAGIALGTGGTTRHKAFYARLAKLNIVDIQKELTAIFKINDLDESVDEFITLLCGIVTQNL